MQPYQRASEEIRNQGEIPVNALKNAGKIAATAATAYAGGRAASSGRAILSKAMNFLSPYIPQEIAKKGLDKIDPRFGKFIKKAEENGWDFDEISDFIKQKAQGDEGEEQQPQQQPKDDRNVIQKYSPELHEFIDQEVKKGRPALHAAAMAQNNSKFADIIKKLTKDYKTQWSNIVESTYGNGQIPQSKAVLHEEGQQQGEQGNARNDLAQAMQQLAQMLQG